MDRFTDLAGEGNPANVYRAYPLTVADRAILLKKFPPRFARVIGDHVSAEGLRSMDKVREGPAAGQVVGVANGDKYQALVVTVNGREITSDGTPFHVSWSVDAGFPSGDIGPAIARDGFDRLAEPIDLDLSTGPTISRPLKTQYLTRK